MKIEQAKQLTEQALDQLIQALEAGKSEALKTYLATMSRFHKYSLGKSSSDRVPDALSHARCWIQYLEVTGQVR